MRVAYVGHEALTFTDYIDLEAGKTLHADEISAQKHDGHPYCVRLWWD